MLLCFKTNARSGNPSRAVGSHLWELNPKPNAYEAFALPIELRWQLENIIAIIPVTIKPELT